VHLNADGSLVVRAGTEVLGTVPTIREISKVLPKCDRDRAVALNADVATEHRRIIELMDALRDLDCDEISFSKH
jgi:biopolymer transport protein ExbD